MGKIISEEKDSKREIKLLNKLISFCEEMSSQPYDNYSQRINDFIAKLKEEQILDFDFVEPDASRDAKIQYVKASMIYDDLCLYDNAFYAIKNNPSSICAMYQKTKNAFLPLALLYSNIRLWGKFHIEDKSMKELKEKIMPGLEFANYVRNKIIGHLEENIIENSVQWEPFIFCTSIKDDEYGQKVLIYRSILETSINSYVDASGKHKIFKKEIDIFYPDTCEMFYTYIEELIKNSLRFLVMLKTKMKSKIVYFNGIPINLIKEAAETNFKIKNKGR